MTARTRSPHVANKHKQVKIEYRSQEAFVDEGLAELILLMWKRGISTFMSCQENMPGIAWIAFDSTYDIHKLALILLHTGFEDWHDKLEMQAQATTKKEIVERGRWHTKINIFEAVDLVSEDEVEPNGDVDVGCSLRFPVTDIPKMVACLKKV